VAGWWLLGSVAGLTLLCGWLSTGGSPPNNHTSPSSAREVFLLTGGLLCVFHFMHYDLVSFSLPTCLAIALVPGWRWGRRSALVVWLLLMAGCAYSYIYGNGILRIPWETFLLLLFWAWMGWLAIRARWGLDGPAHTD
jgi:hypothetical protein